MTKLMLSALRRPAWSLPQKDVAAQRTTRRLVARGCGAFAAVAAVLASLLVGTELWHLHFNRHSLPDVDPFVRFELPTIGRDAADCG